MSYSVHVYFMELALEEAKKAIPSPTAYCVGAVLTDGHGKILSTGYSREISGNTHAEEVCLLKLDTLDLAKGSRCYTTMEPCSQRLSGKLSCVQRLYNAGVAQIYLGAKEPADFVQCRGINDLQSLGLMVCQIKEVEKQCLDIATHKC